MEFYTALLIPGVLTVIVMALSWIYMKNGNRMGSESLIAEINAKNNEKSSTNVPGGRNEEKPTEVQSNSDDNLRAELEPYLINPDDIQEVPGQIPLDNRMIEQEMKEKGMENIQTYFKTSRLQIKEMEGMLTKQEREQEQLAQRKQLEEIYRLMAQEKDKFGVDSMDEIEDQMKLYNMQ